MSKTVQNRPKPSKTVQNDTFWSVFGTKNRDFGVFRGYSCFLIEAVIVLFQQCVVVNFGDFGYFWFGPISRSASNSSVYAIVIGFVGFVHFWGWTPETGFASRARAEMTSTFC